MTDCPFQILGDPELPWQVREKHPPSQKLENLAEKPPFREGAVFGLSGIFRKNEQPGGRWKKRVVRMDATNRLLSIFCPGAVSASFPLLVSTLREPIPPTSPLFKEVFPGEIPEKQALSRDQNHFPLHRQKILGYNQKDCSCCFSGQYLFTKPASADSGFPPWPRTTPIAPTNFLQDIPSR